MMSLPIPVMSSRLPDADAEAYASDPAAPNVQVVEGKLPAPDGSSKSVPEQEGKEENARLRTVPLASVRPKVLIFHYGNKYQPSC